MTTNKKAVGHSARPFQTPKDMWSAAPHYPLEDTEEKEVEPELILNRTEYSFADKRPAHGQVVDVKFPNGTWYECKYYNDGSFDGLLVSEIDGETQDTEVEEYEDCLLWKAK